MTWHRGEGARGPGAWPVLSVGMRVEHAHFGEGVVSVVDFAKVTIAFAEAFGTKRLTLAYTELRVLDDVPENGGQETPAADPK